MRISVLGTGYVGLVAGACLSDSGNHVVCIDVDKEKIRRLEEGVIPIYEPGLDDVVERNIKAGRLTFSTDARNSIAESKMVFIAVGTPPREDGSSDMRYVMEAVAMIKESLTQDAFVIMKSTVPVGTADKVREGLKGTAHRVEVVSNPEFLKEGTAVNDFFRPERVIIGCASDEARRAMGDLYAPYVRNGAPILFMSNRSAELTKYAANTFLAMKISFINELANLAEKVGGDIADVRKGIISDSRIGNKFLYPGCGYGGSCFPKDVLALIQLGKEHDHPLEMFKHVHSINEKQKARLFEKMKKHFGGDLKGKLVTLWGLAFKPETDDIREAPSLTLINELLRAGARVRAFDPVALHEAKKVYDGKVEFFEDAYEAVKKADALAILTEWNAFRSPDFSFLKREMTKPAIFDGRNLYNPESLARDGIVYYCIGKRDPDVRN